MMIHPKIEAFLERLPDHWERFQAKHIIKIERFIQSDGCTAVPEFYHSCCVIHDWFYATHLDFTGKEISRREADRIFRECIQSKSIFGPLSPMSWWRWIAVRMLAGKQWQRSYERFLKQLDE